MAPSDAENLPSPAPPSTEHEAASSESTVVPPIADKDTPASAQSVPASQAENNLPSAPQSEPETVTEQLTYAQIADRLGCSKEAARAIVARRGLPRARGSDGKIRVTINFEEIDYRPRSTRSPGGDRSVAEPASARSPGSDRPVAEPAPPSPAAHPDTQRYAEGGSESATLPPPPAVRELSGKEWVPVAYKRKPKELLAMGITGASEALAEESKTAPDCAKLLTVRYIEKLLRELGVFKKAYRGLHKPRLK